MYNYNNILYKYSYRLSKREIFNLFFNRKYIRRNYLSLHSTVTCTIPSSVNKEFFKIKKITIAKTFENISTRFSSQEDARNSTLDSQNSIFLSYLDSGDRPVYNLLCPNISLPANFVDPLLTELQNSSTIEEIFEALKEHQGVLSVDHACQAVFSLSQIKNMRKLINFKSLNQYSIPDENFETYPEFLRSISVIKENILKVKEKIPSLIMCLDNLNLELHHHLMIDLHIHVLEMVPDLKITSLVQVSFVFHDKGMKGYFTQCLLISKANKLLNDCNSIKDLRLVSILYLNTKKLISKESAHKYLCIIQRFLEENKFDASDPNIIILILKVINVLYKLEYPIHICRPLMKLLLNVIQDLTTQQLIALNGIFLNVQEPRNLLYKIQEHASRLIEEPSSLNLKSDLLLCLIPCSSFKLKNYYESMLLDLIALPQKDIGTLYKALRFIKTSNYDIYYSFWWKALADIKNKFNETDADSLGARENVLFHMYGKYIFFNNGVKGRFRERDVEKQICSYLELELKGPAQHIPTRVSRMIGFMIGYSNEENVLPSLYKNIERNIYQFNKFDLTMMSKGVQIQISNKFKNKEKIYYLGKINTLLDLCTESLLQDHSSLADVTSLTSSYLNRRGPTSTPLFDTLAQKHLNCMDQLNSKNITQMLRNFKVASYNIPEVFESIVDYVIKHEDSILPTTIHRILFCFYALGFHSTNATGFAESCQKIIDIDCEKLSCHELLECCLALCFYKALSSDLIHYTFSVQFLDQLEDEMRRAYSKSYPLLMRSLLMKLNRSVCLDYPEEKVPWFHEKYCRDQCEFESETMLPLHQEVREVLSMILGDENLIRVNKKSPYYYNLDMEFGLSHDGRPVPVHRLHKTGSTDAPDDPFKRVCVLLRNEKCYSSNDRSLSGPCQAEQRHLEILGYIVVEVPHHSWNSMALGSKKDKMKLLKSLIYTQLTNVS